MTNVANSEVATQSKRKRKDDTMDQTMTAPKQKCMTDGQIDDLVNKLRAAARKHRNKFDSKAVQSVLGTDNLGMVLLAPFRELVEMVSTMFIRLVGGINRNQTFQEALDATGRKQYTNRSVVDTMPHGEGENVELRFFELDYDPSTKELDVEYGRRGLKADPFALVKHMEDDPAFADERPVACQWDLGENGIVSYATFGRGNDGWYVNVDRGGSRWNCYYRFAGVCR